VNLLPICASTTDSEPSDIAKILRIDDYIGEIIYQETKKATRNIISNSNF
jgi:hypothetical protein